MGTKKLLMTAIMLISVGLTNCKKPEKGDPGPQGKPGNANVLNYELTVKPYQWTYNSTYKFWYYRYYLSLNYKSGILGYVMSGNGYQAMPYYASAFGEQYDMANYLFGSPGYIEFQYTNFNSVTTAPTSDEYFSIVAIPPAIKVQHPNVNWNNYSEVKSAFNLPD